MLSEGLYVELTPQIGALLKAAWSRRKELPSELKSLLEPYSSSVSSELSDTPEVQGVKYSILKQVWQWMSHEGEWNRMFLHELMRGTAHFVPPAPVVEKDPEFVARLERMRTQVENRLYAKMVANVSNEWVKRAEEQGRADLKTGLDTAKVSLNLIFSVAAVFIATYFVTWNAYQDTTTSISVSAIAAIGIFLVETILFVLRGTQLDSKVFQQRQEADLGQSSPFPPAAPSLIEAERKLRIENASARRQQKKQKQDEQLRILKLDGGEATSIGINTSTNAIGPLKKASEEDETEIVQPLLSENVNTHKNRPKEEKLSVSKPVETMALDNGGGAVIDDE